MIGVLEEWLYGSPGLDGRQVSVDNTMVGGVPHGKRLGRLVVEGRKRRMRGPKSKKVGQNPLAPCQVSASLVTLLVDYIF